VRILFLFLDGVGLGDDDPSLNPFVIAELPTLHSLTHGQRWLRGIGEQITERATFLPVDPRLGVPGRPQSGSSQAVILTGQNVPQALGRHYGPKPDATIRELLTEDNLFRRLRAQGKRTALIDGYPPGLLASIERGKTLPSSIQYAAIASGQDLFTAEDVRQERAITAEWTGDEWHTHLNITDVPRYTPYEAGRQIVTLAQAYDFAFHSHWLTDYVGHRGPFDFAVQLLERFDGVLRGVLDAWEDDAGLVIITSDHGNLEHIGSRQHTENDVPAVIIGKRHREFAAGLRTLMDFAPRIQHMLLNETD